MRHPLKRWSTAVLALALALGLSGCFGGSKTQRRANKAELQERLRKLETPGLLLGEFPLAKNAVVDGDTIKVAGLNASLRLTGMDTEETFKSEGDRRLFEMGWEHYLKTKRGKSRHPVKAASPLGEDAKKFAKAFFADADTVRLERDHPKEIRDRYNRYLAYAFAKKNGEWVNYNVEAVRAGMSPYFMKYAYSRRFHDQFAAAQQEARAAQRGIWKPGAMAYPDYPERLRWWEARARYIKAFEEEAEGKDDYVILTQWDSLKRLEAKLDQQVTVFGTVGEIKLGDRGPTVATLSRRMFGDLQIVFFDKDVFLGSCIGNMTGEFVRVRGAVTKYRDRFRKREYLQIVVNLPGQVECCPLDSAFAGSDPAQPPMPEPRKQAAPARAEPAKAGEPAPAEPEPPEDEDETWEQWAPPAGGVGEDPGDEGEDGGEDEGADTRAGGEVVGDDLGDESGDQAP
ncbi:MAG TPA: OB-fold nucleic acid binding domain-containing protein [Myxococcota bacterium]|nr:OB-fold nucleic acid binding domain-containing protein [Myxococcota bacterium]HRY95476.1 OB-fold nucleic acid binding domain-containing protein [Myxococcota bacterium]HSA22206.1 OB-fold nucleic acid binding domain-containing protein [Myxococcota bacterium]